MGNVRKTCQVKFLSHWPIKPANVEGRQKLVNAKARQEPANISKQHQMHIAM